MSEMEWLASEDPAAMLQLCTSDEMPWPAGTPAPVVSDRKLRLFACAVARAQLQLIDHGRPHDRCTVECIEVAEVDADGEPPSDTLLKAWRGDKMWCCEPDPRIAAQECVAILSDRCLTASLLRDIVGNPFRPEKLPEIPATESPRCLRCGCERCTHDDGTCRCDDCGCEEWTNPIPPVGWWQDETVLDLATAAYEERPGRKCERCSGSGWVRVHDGKQASATSTGYGWKRVDCPTCHGTGHIEDGTLDPLRLAILADALEEAECETERREQCPSCDGMKGYNEVGPNTFWQECRRCNGLGYVLTPNPILAHLRSPGPHVRGCWAIDCVLGRE